MTEYRVAAHRVDSHGSLARAKDARSFLTPTWPVAGMR